MNFSKSRGRSIEVLVFTDSVGAEHLQVRLGRTVVAALGQTFSPPLAASRCNRVLGFGGTCGYPLGVTALRRWHVSLTVERAVPGMHLSDDIEGI